MEILRDLSCLAASSLADKDHSAILLQRIENVLAKLIKHQQNDQQTMGTEPGTAPTLKTGSFARCWERDREPYGLYGTTSNCPSRSSFSVSTWEPGAACPTITLNKSELNN
jgi:hypothetical protein